MASRMAEDIGERVQRHDIALTSARRVSVRCRSGFPIPGAPALPRNAAVNPGCCKAIGRKPRRWPGWRRSPTPTGGSETRRSGDDRPAGKLRQAAAGLDHPVGKAARLPHPPAKLIAPGDCRRGDRAGLLSSDFLGDHIESGTPAPRCWQEEAVP
jgi:hypothetical protein